MSDPPQGEVGSSIGRATRADALPFGTEPNRRTLEASALPDIGGSLPSLGSDLVLQVARNLKVNIKSRDEVELVLKSATLSAGPHALAVLDAFMRSVSISEALAALQERVRGVQDWMDLTTTIVQFYENGVLQAEPQSGTMPVGNPSGFGAPPVHVSMLNDSGRTTSFLSAVRETVRPGDVVLEIGTGTGILAIAAAQAGARRVYAIEAADIASCAEAMFDRNGLRDRITLVRGWSTQVVLPERADVLVSELIGNDPLEEHVLEITGDALNRLLKPGARLIPRAVRVLTLPLEIPREELGRRTFTRETLRRWQERYGIDFSALGDAAGRSPHAFYIRPHLASQWTALGEPVVVAELVLGTTRPFMIDSTAMARATRSGELNGLLVYFDLTLGRTTRLSTHPEVADAECNWRLPVWIIGEPLRLQAGEEFGVTYRYRIPGSSNGAGVFRAPR